MVGRRFNRGHVAALAAVVVLGGCATPALVSTTLAPTAAPGGRGTPTAHPDIAGPSASATPAARSAAATSAPATSAEATAGDAARAAERSASAPLAGEAEDWRSGEGVAGFDVSRYQETVDWAGLMASGHRFVYVKVSEGTGHISPTHTEQREAAREAGLIQGGYHYARPSQSSGTLQARFFSASGGQWAPDGRTLPGALDLEFNTNGERCYDLSPADMVQWVREFSDEYRRTSGRAPVIYTKAEVWDACTGGDTSFGDHSLWLYDHADRPGALPAGWERPTLWQRAVQDDLDRNVFFGSTDDLAQWVRAPLR